MNNLPNSKPNDFLQLQILHGALMMSAVMICLVLGFVMSREGKVASFTGWTDGLLLYAMIFMAFEIGISHLLWNNRQSNIPVTNVQTEKWMHYRTSCILRWACLQGGILISVILSYLEQNTAGFAIAAVGLAFLFLARPSRDYVAENYGLND